MSPKNSKKSSLEIGVLTRTIGVLTRTIGVLARAPQTMEVHEVC